MKLARHQLADLIGERSLSQGASKKLPSEVAAYLLSQNAVSQLEPLMRDVQTYWADLGQVEIIARSAFTLPASLKADLIKQLKPLFPKAKRVWLTEVRDDSVIGGVELGLANARLDLTVATKLNKLKRLAAK